MSWSEGFCGGSHRRYGGDLWSPPGLTRVSASTLTHNTHQYHCQIVARRPPAPCLTVYHCSWSSRLSRHPSAPQHPPAPPPKVCHIPCQLGSAGSTHQCHHRSLFTAPLSALPCPITSVGFHAGSATVVTGLAASHASLVRPSSTHRRHHRSLFTAPLSALPCPVTSMGLHAGPATVVAGLAASHASLVRPGSTHQCHH